MGFKVAGISPDRVELWSGFDVPETMITLWAVSGVIVVLLLLFRFIALPRFKYKPKGFQNIIEYLVSMGVNITKDKLHDKSRGIASYVVALAIVLVLSGLVELFGFRAPGTDINFTFAMAGLSFILINVCGIFYKGLWGRIKLFGKPVAALAPINVITHCAIPISLACRMFGNLFSGLVIMDLLYYALGWFAVGIPAVLSVYFNLFHVAMQTYVFIILTLSFVNETVE